MKIGDLVYYETDQQDTPFRFCYVKDIIENEVWGDWQFTIEEARIAQGSQNKFWVQRSKCSVVDSTTTNLDIEILMRQLGYHQTNT